MIRMSFLQGFNQGVNGILRAQEKTFATQAQVATGKRLQTAADDPVAAARIVKIDQEQSQTKQFINNADSLESRLSLEESQLDGVTGLLARVRQQTVYAANGVLSKNERQIIAIEIKGRLDELVNLANTRDSNGEYIFSGYKGGEPAFVEDNNGDFTYQGDDGQRRVRIATSTSIPSNDSGKDIFVDVNATQNMFFTEVSITNGGSGRIAAGSVIDSASFSSSDPSGYTVTYDADLLGGPPAPFFTVDGNSDGTSVNVVANGTATTLDLYGWTVDIEGAPSDGDQFILDSSSSPKQSMMDTLGKLIQGLDNLTDSPEDRKTLSLLMAESLDNLSSAEQNIAGVTAKIGARFNTLFTVRDVNQGVELVNEQILADIRDLDYAEAISRLTQQSFTLEAAQQSFAKVSSFSLFRFL
ncbi:MAG: flagellar hook-associated protein 3 FlgL [Oceanicoccus sp.]|jgi:flagellar hook-associated protein 3 FlgL